MGKQIDLINIIDVESTCWETKAPIGEVSEIIEIGICSLDTKTLKVQNQKSLLVHPKESIISEFCTKLTTIMPTMTNNCPSFEQALNSLKQEYQLSERIWASYGDYDRKMFQNQCARLHLQYPFGSRHINIKTLAAVGMNWEREIGMNEALRKLNIPLLGTHHRAGDDAVNIANILAFLLSKVRTQEKP
jgi:inhibitor of KinA sporulation pathway (predicted exonuclease)